MQQNTTSITLRAYAKINIGLDVLSKRSDGYHDIKTLMHNIGLYDVLYCEKSGVTEVNSDDESLQNDESNIIYRCAEMMKRRYKTDGSIKVNLKKRIPMQAGLGGGSSDGAAAIYAFCKLHGIKFDPGELTAEAAKIGADIPFFLYGGCCICEGIGQNVTPQSETYSLPCVIVKPKLSVSTALAYKFTDAYEGTRKTSDFERIKQGLSDKLRQLNTYINNDFELYLKTLSADAAEIKTLLTKNGAIASGLSGSGSAYYGIFPNRFLSENAAEIIKKILPEASVFDTSLKEVSFEEI